MNLGVFEGQDLTWLTTLRTQLRDAILAVALARTHSIAGRSVTREDLPTLKTSLREVQAEIDRQNGTTSASLPSVIVADFSQTSAT